MDEKKKDPTEPTNLDDVEVEPLSDSALESVSGGLTGWGGSSDGCCSCENCSNPPPPHCEIALQKIG